jgi:transposase
VNSFNFLPLNREQDHLMPPSLRDWLPEGDLSWFVLDAVSQMDLTPFYAKYRADGWGHAAYEPSMMVCLLLYAYCLGVRSSRQIERLCERDIGFRVITANQAPDHSTIARFRQANEEALTALFTQALRLCAEAGLVKVGTMALDGTKMKANASLAANRKYASIEAEVKRMLEEAAAKDAEEDELYGPDRRGDELPEDLRYRRKRLTRLKEPKRGWSMRRQLKRRNRQKRSRNALRKRRRLAVRSVVASRRSRMTHRRWRRRPTLPIQRAGS